MLDLEYAVNQARAAEGQAPIDGSPEPIVTRPIFVAPASDELPDDGILQYMVVASVYDMKDVPERCVALFDMQRSAEVFKLVCANAPLFGLELRALVGVPGSAYPIQFDEATWNLERVAYAPLISEIRLAAETEQQRRASLLSGHDIERAQYTRSNGTVRVDHKIDLATTEADDGLEDE